MERQRVVIFDSLAGAACVGVAIGAVVAAFVDVSYIWMGASAVCAAALFLYSFRAPKWQLVLRCGALVFVCIIFGYYRMQLAEPYDTQYAPLLQKTVTISGIVSGEPNVKQATQSFVLERPDFSVAVSADKHTEVLYGDEVSVTAVLEVPENFSTNQGSEFDYISYLYKDGVLYVMKKADVRVLSHGHGSWIRMQLMRFENTILDSFKKQLSSREANLLGGLVLGTKSAIDPAFRDALVATGTIHIIALSGFNVTIVANTLRGALARIPMLGPTVGSAAGALGIVLFVAMTGLQSSAVRAGIMAVIALVARSTGRQYAAFRALVIAAVCMILWDPKYLVYDVSFQLSFLATLGILFITPLLARAFARVPEKVFFIPLRETIATTLGAQLSVLPFILYKMGTLSLIALPANMVVLPAIPFSMALGTVIGFLGMVWKPLSLPFAYIAHFLLQYVIRAITFFASVPFASVTIERFPLWLCIGMYGVGTWCVSKTFRNQSAHAKLADSV